MTVLYMYNCDYNMIIYFILIPMFSSAGVMANPNAHVLPAGTTQVNGAAPPRARTPKRINKGPS
jgi:hypothetical protein